MYNYWNINVLKKLPGESYTIGWKWEEKCIFLWWGMAPIVQSLTRGRKTHMAMSLIVIWPKKTALLINSDAAKCKFHWSLYSGPWKRQQEKKI